MGSILLNNADYVVLSQDQFLRKASIYIEGNRIHDIGRAKQTATAYDAEEIIDCSGQIIIPGIINSHNHLYEIAARGLGKDHSLDEWIREVVYPVNQMLSSDDYYHLELLGCADAARNGTTGILEMMTSFARFHVDQGIKAFTDFGMRGAVARSSSSSSKISDLENRPAEEDLRASKKYLDRWMNNDLVKPWLGPSMMITCEPSLIYQLKKMSNDFGTKFHIHLAETLGLVSIARQHGYLGDVAWANAHGILDNNTVIAHAVWVSEPELELVRTSGSQIVHNPSSNQLLADGIAPVRRMLEKGILVALGSDGPASNDSLDMIAEMKSCVLMSRVSALDARALSAKQAFAMATANGARVLGVEKLGQLAKGFLADLTCVTIRNNPSMNPVYDPVEALVYCGSGRDVSLTMINGQIVYKDGAFPTFDIDESLSRLSDISERVRGLLELG